jgi:hypothetical protein
MPIFWLVVAASPITCTPLRGLRSVPIDVAWLQLDASIDALHVPAHFGPLQVAWRAENNWKADRTCDNMISYVTDATCDNGIIYVTHRTYDNGNLYTEPPPDGPYAHHYMDTCSATTLGMATVSSLTTWWAYSRQSECSNAV